MLIKIRTLTVRTEMLHDGDEVIEGWPETLSCDVEAFTFGDLVRRLRRIGAVAEPSCPLDRWAIAEVGPLQNRDYFETGAETVTMVALDDPDAAAWQIGAAPASSRIERYWIKALRAAGAR